MSRSKPGRPARVIASKSSSSVTKVVAASLVLLALVAGVIGTTVGLLEARRQAGIARDEAWAKESVRAEEAKQRGIAEANERRAVAAAEQERLAKVQIASQLKQIELVNETVFDIFDGFDVRKVKASGEPVEAVLAKRLVEAGRKVDAKAISDPLVLAHVRNRLGLTLLNLGYTRDAIELFLAARATWSEKLGSDHPDTLSSMSNLAMAYREDGKFDLSLPLFEETLKLAKAKLGPDHPFTLSCMSNLAEGYRDVGKLDLTLPLLEETLKLTKARLGPDHPSTLTSMNNLAVGYRDIGKLDLGLPLYEETLRLVKAKFGPDHPDTLTSMNNLANGYGDAGKLDLAIPLHEETLKLTKARLGPDHPDTLLYMGNLAEGYREVGKLDLALPLYEEATLGSAVRCPLQSNSFRTNLPRSHRPKHHDSKYRWSLLVKTFVEHRREASCNNSPRWHVRIFDHATFADRISGIRDN